MKVLMVFFLVIIITLIAPVKKTADSGPIMGDIVIDASWPDGDVDIDLWVQAPKDLGPVGYSRRSDAQTSYLRDDIGERNDSSGRNYELAAIRGLEPGRYVVNLHLYSIRVGPLPQRVKVVAAITKQGAARRELAVVDVDLVADGQELTAFSFELDASGLPGPISREFIELRNAKQSPQQEYSHE
jgi:hypothetical protein